MEWKDKGNEFFKLGAYGSAVQCYIKAINEYNSSKTRIKGLDLATLLSNRAAAYIKYGKPKEALDDAEECVKLKPKWGKAYGRKGKALFELGRFKEALECYQEGVVFDSSNQTLRDGMRHCEEKIAEDNDEYEEDAVNGDEIDDFLNDVNTLSSTKKMFEAPKPKSRFTVDHKEQTRDWSTENQVDRILCDKYEWHNINPFVVLALPFSASEHDIKRRFRKLSQLLHPDKLKLPSTMTTVRASLLKKQAETAFDQVQQANGKLKNEKLRPKIITTIERVTKRVKDSRERLLKKGLQSDELGDEKAEIDAEVKKEFATMEHMRLKSETLKRKYEMRERDNKKKEKTFWQKVKKKELDFRQQREDRINEWQQFNKEGQEEKLQGFDYQRSSNVKAEMRKKRENERRKFKGFGVDETYKNEWR